MELGAYWNSHIAIYISVVNFSCMLYAVQVLWTRSFWYFGFEKLIVYDVVTFFWWKL
jgi:hypothetical protein